LFLGVFVVVAFGYFVGCDLLPKMIFRLFPNRLSLAAAIPFRLVHLALSPLTWLVEGISAGLMRLTGRTAQGTPVLGSRRELRWFMEEAGQNLSSEERTLINRVLDLHDLPIGRIATPMENTTTVPMDAPLREAARLCRERDRTRLPVWKPEGRERRIVGVVSLRNFLYETEYDETTPVRQKMTPPLFLRQEMRVEAALRRLQRSGQRIAIVVGPDQREVGVVTLRDILKAIFGEVNL
jgi:putative hemolysin